MLDRETLGIGLAAMAEAWGRKLNTSQVGVYYHALEDLSNEQFTEAANILIRAWQPTRLEWFPSPATIRKASRPHVDLDVMAVTAFEQVCQRGCAYTPERGDRYTWRLVFERLGALTAEAFVAAGAGSAFETEQTDKGLPFLRGRFVEAWKRGWDAKEQGRFPAVEERPAIRSGDQQRVMELGHTIGNGPRQITRGSMRPIGTDE